MRITDPDRERPFRIPFDVTMFGARVPLPTVIAAILTALAWVSVIIYHDTARWVGGGWMVFGLVSYVIYRKGVEGTTLTDRVEVPAEALVKDQVAVESGDILVPVFGTKARRRHRRHRRPARRRCRRGRASSPPRLEVVYVIDLPLTVPLDSPPPPDRAAAANAALERAQQVGEEYETVEVHLSVIRARSVGARDRRRQPATAGSR